MALRIRFQYLTGQNLGFSIERLADGLILDQADMTFKITPGTVIGNLAESATPYQGLYKLTLANTPVAQFSNGNYAINIHNTLTGNQIIAVLSAQMISGDDNSIPSGGSGGTVDLTGIPQSVWNYAMTSMGTAGSVGQLVKDNIDAKISSRSTFAGGAVQSVTQPVTVGTNQDKAGYLLGAAGLDSIVVETGVNARQALVPILAATSGVISGSTTGQITIKGGNTSTTRILATTDNLGNRTSVVLTLPS